MVQEIRRLRSKPRALSVDGRHCLRPNRFGDGIFRRGYGAGVAGSRIGSPEFVMKLDTFEGAVDHGFEFVEIFYFASLGQAALGLRRADPCRLAVGFVGPAHPME